MRILAFSDLHCDRKLAEIIVRESDSADIVVGAGDFGIRGERTIELFDTLDEISVPFLLVSGNHDRCTELTSYCETRDKLYLLDGSAQEVNGITFFGLGREIPSRNHEKWNETMEEHVAAQVLKKAGKHNVLITHTPPYGHCDLQHDGTHEGSEAIANAIKQHAPSLCLCGHIHHSWGSTAQLQKTAVHNLGPKPSWHVVTDLA